MGERVSLLENLREAIDLLKTKQNKKTQNTTESKTPGGSWAPGWPSVDPQQELKEQSKAKWMTLVFAPGFGDSATGGQNR